MENKKILYEEEVNDFTASNRQLDSWKKIYGVPGKRLCGEADDVSTTTVEPWIERLPGFCQGYEPQNVLNLDKFELFFRALPEKGLAEKKKQSKGRKKIVIANDSHVYCAN